LGFGLKNTIFPDWFSVAADLSISATSPRSPTPSLQHNKSDSTTTVELACLTIQISPVDKCLLISTAESDSPGADLDTDVAPGDCVFRVPVPELREQHHWCHLVVVLQKAVGI
jgi:hypothetical protein